MKSIEVGNILYGTDLLKNTFFENSVICITEVKVDGPVGFVINKKFDRKLNELVEFQNQKPLSLFVGGPMENDKLFFLHRRNDIIPNGELIQKDVYLGGDFLTMLDLRNKNQIQTSDIKLLLGYCGWDNGQLEQEIEEGSWRMENLNQELIWEK